jgi:hypothetical protein
VVHAICTRVSKSNPSENRVVYRLLGDRREDPKEEAESMRFGAVGHWFYTKLGSHQETVCAAGIELVRNNVVRELDSLTTERRTRWLHR